MKIWANNLKIGDTVWYEWPFTFKQATVVLIDRKTFAIPTIEFDNGDKIFANKYCYTDKSDITNEMINDMIQHCQDCIKSHNETITEMYRLIDNMNTNINNLKQIKV